MNYDDYDEYEEEDFEREVVEFGNGVLETMLDLCARGGRIVTVQKITRTMDLRSWRDLLDPVEEIMGLLVEDGVAFQRNGGYGLTAEGLLAARPIRYLPPINRT